MEDYIALLNEANRNLGLINAEITAETIDTLQGLSEPQQRALFDQLYLIAEQRGHENIFTAEQNNFRAFLVDISTEFGWTIEDYMLEVLDGVSPQWINDDTYTDVEQAQNLVKDYEQKVKGTFHSRRFAKQFPTTIRDYEYKKSFYPSKFGAFINRKVSMLNTSAEIYLQNNVLIDEVKQMISDGDMKVKSGYSVNNSNGILSLLEALKTDYRAFSTPVNLYNADEVISITPYDDLKFLITKESVLNRIKVREYSAAFNINQMKLEGRIITVPENYDLGQVDGEDILAVLLDRRAIVIAIKMWKMGTFYVANQYKTNHWLGVEGVRGHNRFINAVAYTGETFGNFLDEGETPSVDETSPIVVYHYDDSGETVISSVDDSSDFIHYPMLNSVFIGIDGFYNDANDIKNCAVLVKNKCSFEVNPNASTSYAAVVFGSANTFTHNFSGIDSSHEIVFDFEHSLIYYDETPISIPLTIGDIRSAQLYSYGAD